MVTKSGTNHFHGQLFELNQNNIMLAKTFNQGSINSLNHNEFGGQVGGPVLLPKLYNGRDKTFFFVDLEGIKQSGFGQADWSLPLAQYKAGNLAGFPTPQGSPDTIYDPNTTTFNAATGSYARTAFPGNVIPTNRINPVSAKIFSYLPNPNVNIPYYQGPNYLLPNGSSTLTNKLYTGKVDQVFGPNRLAMRYTYTDENTLKPYLPLNPTVQQSGGSNGAVEFTQVLSPRAINEVRAGVQYNHNFEGPQPITPPITQTLGLPTYQDTIAWPSFYYDYYNMTGIDRANPKDYPDSTITLSDRFSYNRGNHQLMAGFLYQNYRVNTYEVGQPGGGYAFYGNFTALQDPAQVAKGTYNQPVANSGAGIADFLLGDSSGVQLNIYPHYHTGQSEYAGFVNDDWRATPNLTLNLGLRYTYWTAFSDRSGLQSTFDSSIPGGMVVYQGTGALPSQTPAAVLNSFKAAGLPIESSAQAGYPSSLWNMPKNNFEPRLGFAYQIGSKRVLRGGWGMYHWVMPLQQYQQATRKNPPFSYSSFLEPGEIGGTNTDVNAAELEFPIASANYGGPQPLTQFALGSPSFVLNTSDVSISQGGGFAAVPFDTNYKAPTAQEYNLTVEQELPGHVGFQLSYIGNHSYNLLQFDPFNYLIPRADCTAAQGGPACTPEQRRQFPIFATSTGGGDAMDDYIYKGYSNNNELQTQIQHTFGTGLLLQAYFTWQRVLTTTEDGNLGKAASVIFPASLTNNAPLSQRIRGVYSPDANEPFHTFSVNGHYEFPFGKGKQFLGNAHGIVNGLVSGYNISPFFYWRSGLPFAPYYTAFNSGSVSGNGFPINLAPGKTGILPKSQRTPQHWFDASVDDQSAGVPYTGQTYIIGPNPLDGDLRNNIPKNYMTGPGFNELDATFYKFTPITQTSVLDIEAQVFNVYNHQNLGQPNNHGVISNGVGLPRMIQLQAKYIF